MAMTSILKIILSPFGLLYRVITGIRNHLFNIGNKKSHQFSLLTVGVGNLKVGGVGKTPFCEYLLQNFLDENRKVVYLSRGYGRKTKGFLEVTSDSNAQSVGDEPLQIASKFNDIQVFVCEDRALAVPEILHRYPETEVIVLDDVYQHRSIKPHVNLLLTAYSDLFSNDFILPVGRLRESRKGANRADLVVVTKVPQGVTDQEKQKCIESINPYINPGAQILFAGSNYKEKKTVLGQGGNTSSDVVVVSALANNDVFVNQVKTSNEVVKSFGYRDHHQFNEKEIEEIITFAHKENCKNIVTTEKDWQRLKKFVNQFQENNLTIDVLPFYFELEDEGALWNLINNEEAKV